MPARGGEGLLLLPRSLRENCGAGAVQGLQGGDFTSPGMHRQVVHSGFLFDSLQLFYIKAWVVFFE